MYSLILIRQGVAFGTGIHIVLDIAMHCLGGGGVKAYTDDVHDYVDFCPKHHPQDTHQTCVKDKEQ